MAKVKDNFYFQNFLECIRISGQAAEKLQDIIRNYDNDRIMRKSMK